MACLQRVLKMFGSIICEDKDGNKEVWLYDYVTDKPRLKSEMTKEEIKASEKAKNKIFKYQQ